MKVNHEYLVESGDIYDIYLSFALKFFGSVSHQCLLTSHNKKNHEQAVQQSSIFSLLDLGSVPLRPMFSNQSFLFELSVFVLSTIIHRILGTNSSFCVK